MAYFAGAKWTANTAYAAGAVVTPTTVPGTVWRTAAAGTSGNTEPTWPSGTPWTVVDGTLTWSKGTTFRVDVNEGIAGVLQAFATANPTLLRKVYSERPLSIGAGELPAAWIDSQPEVISHSSGIRQRQQNAVTVGIADATPAPEEFSDRLNFLVDALVDAFTAAYHAASSTSILQMTAIADIDVPEGAVHLSGVSITLEGYVAEGRT